jgi:cytochrome c peroxidase
VRGSRKVRVTFVLVVGAATLILGATPQAPLKTGPIPEAGPLAQPKSLQQVGAPLDATRAAIPPDNPQTPEKIALGQRLFFDGRLSADGSVACSTCHDPARAFTDGKPASIGIKDRAGQRNAPTILNALYNKTQFWDGRVKTLEEQAALPIVNPVEMGQPSMDAAVTRIAAIAEYQRAFRSVFGRPPNGPDGVDALAEPLAHRVAECRVVRASSTVASFCATSRGHVERAEAFDEAPCRFRRKPSGRSD